MDINEEILRQMEEDPSKFIEEVTEEDLKPPEYLSN